MEDHQSDSQIQQFYKNKKIFITGGTGFLGKLLVEKLLRSTEVSAIYFLIRSKKGKDVHTRLDEYFDDVVFQRLKTEAPKFKHKIIAIPGDCAAAGLGMSMEDRQMLIKNVDVVFHVAATVNFNEKLKLAHTINVKGTESILDLCRHIENLKVYIHVSTVYSQCHLNEIDEVFYDCSVNYKDLDTILQKLDEDSINRYTPKILGKSPNTYTFTKALAEALIRDQASGLPVGIFRPAIVISTYKEPIEAWIDNLYGPTGVCAGGASGVIRTIQCKQEAVANLVPADTCVAALIVAAWDVANRTCERSISNIPIYNYVSTVENPLTWAEYHVLNRIWLNYYPISSSLWCIKFDSVENKTMNDLRKFFYHLLPATIIDTFNLFSGRKPRIIKLYSKIHKFSDVLSYFSTREWKFRNDNVIKLWYKLNQTDRELFPFSMANVHWTTYFKKYVLGIRIYLLKDSENTIPQARTRNRRLTLLHSFLKFILSFIVANLLWNSIYKSLGWIITKMALL